MDQQLAQIDTRIQGLATQDSRQSADLVNLGNDIKQMKSQFQQETLSLQKAGEELERVVGEVRTSQNLVSNKLMALEGEQSGYTEMIERTKTEMNEVIGSLKTLLVSLRQAMQSSLNTIDQQLSNLDDG